LAALVSSASAETYSLAGDFTYAENNADSLWSFRMDDFVNHPPTFLPLLDDNSRNAATLWGTAFASPPLLWSEGGGYWGGVAGRFPAGAGLSLGAGFRLRLSQRAAHDRRHRRGKSRRCRRSHDIPEKLEK